MEIRVEGIVSNDEISNILDQLVKGSIKMIGADRCFQMFPKTFNRIEIRWVRRQSQQQQAMLKTSERCLNRSTVMKGSIIQYEY